MSTLIDGPCGGSVRAHTYTVPDAGALCFVFVFVRRHVWGVWCMSVRSSTEARPQNACACPRVSRGIRLDEVAVEGALRADGGEVGVRSLVEDAAPLIQEVALGCVSLWWDEQVSVKCADGACPFVS